MNLLQAAKGIEYWFRFYQAIGKADLLNEDSIKYPLIEYLVAGGDDSIKHIKLEEPHPVFSSREVDLISITASGQVNYCIEFKLASKLTMQIQERQRIFDDIARLYFVQKKHNVGSYLVVAGKTIDFLSEFRSVINKTPGKRGPKKKTKDDKPKLRLIDPHGFFSDKWLSFDMDSPIKEIDITVEKDGVYKSHYDRFIAAYTEDGQPALELPDKISTELLYITEINDEDTNGNVPAMVGIWQIVPNK